MTTLTYPSDQITITERIVRNAVRCLACDTIIESTFRHDYRTCGCPNGTMVDGGHDYLRWGGVDLDQVESLAEHSRSGVIVADGEQHILPEGDPCVCRPHPPARLLALTEPCPTCGGEGTRWVGVMFPKPYDCRDCHEGRQTFTLVEESTDASGHYHSKAHLGDGWVITHLLPIKQDFTAYGSPAVVLMCEPMMSAGQASLVYADERASVRITLPPAARPGMWAALIEQETP